MLRVSRNIEGAIDLSLREKLSREQEERVHRLDELYFPKEKKIASSSP